MAHDYDLSTERNFRPLYVNLDKIFRLSLHYVLVYNYKGGAQFTQKSCLSNPGKNWTTNSVIEHSTHSVFYRFTIYICNKNKATTEAITTKNTTQQQKKTCPKKLVKHSQTYNLRHLNPYLLQYS